MVFETENDIAEEIWQVFTLILPFTINIPRHYSDMEPSFSFTVADSGRASCTIAVAFIDSVASGEPIPELPMGRRYGRTDTADMIAIMDCAAMPVVTCMNYGKEGPGVVKQMGWTQAGESKVFSYLTIESGSLEVL